MPCSLTYTHAKKASGYTCLTYLAVFPESDRSSTNSASLRSRNIPIRDVAMEFGGGGHECAGGIKNLTRNQVDQIIEILSNREVA